MAIPPPPPNDVRIEQSVEQAKQEENANENTNSQNVNSEPSNFTEAAPVKNDNLNEDTMKDTPSEKRALRIVFFGKPGAGKGTHAPAVSKLKGIPIISTGDCIRGILKSEDEETKTLRETLRSYTSRGALVPDELVVDILKNRISKPDCKNGYILDGFPRTDAQAKALASIGENVSVVIHLDIDNETIVKRMVGRRSCPKCGKPYNVNSPDFAPKVEGKCDDCNVDLVQREDDNEETVRNRLKVYEAETAPLIKFYSDKGILKTVDAGNSLDQVSTEIAEIVNNVKPVDENAEKK